MRSFFLIISLCTCQLFASERQLMWSDEFNKEGRPDPQKWKYEEGFVRNQEKQYYTRDRKENARVEKGCLVIEARKELYPNRAYKAGSNNWRHAQEQANYTSAALITHDRASWQYGRIEVRAKLPRGHGMWPAIWMMGTDRPQVGWPQCGEIDILEQLGRLPNKIHGTVHWAAGKDPKSGKKKHLSNGGHIQAKTPPHANFHLYAIEWSAEKITFFFDNKAYHTVDLSKLPAEQAAQFRKPHYLLINLALGGTWGGKLDDSALPQRYLIDYVRVYR